MSDTVIKVEGLYKKFCRNLKRSMFYGTVDVARSMFGIQYDTGKLRKDEFWALQDINFELKRVSNSNPVIAIKISSSKKLMAGLSL